MQDLSFEAEEASKIDKFSFHVEIRRIDIAAILFRISFVRTWPIVERRRKLTLAGVPKPPLGEPGQVRDRWAPPTRDGCCFSKMNRNWKKNIWGVTIEYQIIIH